MNITSPKSIFVVVGHTGKYDDATSWNVGASRNVHRANALRDRLNEWCKANGFDPSRNGIVYTSEKPEEDPQFICLDGTSYTVDEIPDLDVD